MPKVDVEYPHGSHSTEMSYPGYHLSGSPVSRNRFYGARSLTPCPRDFTTRVQHHRSSTPTYHRSIYPVPLRTTAYQKPMGADGATTTPIRAPVAPFAEPGFRRHMGAGGRSLGKSPHDF
mmetsp:Transcript_67620/g.211491  ORF Transcript_67620/g.211491 Transcript_67620/m.211491 type:complete len:120 (-) Transcript_67620:103-462(-)